VVLDQEDAGDPLRLSPRRAHGAPPSRGGPASAVTLAGADAPASASGGAGGAGGGGSRRGSHLSRERPTSASWGPGRLGCWKSSSRRMPGLGGAFFTSLRKT